MNYELIFVKTDRDRGTLSRSPHLQKSFRELGFEKGDFPIAEEIADTALSLPIWPGMEAGAVQYVCEIIRKFFHS